MPGLSIGNRLTPTQGISVGGGLSRGSGGSFGGFRPSPVLSLNFLNTTTLSSVLAFSRPSLGMLFDSTGKYTWCPNNLLTFSNTFSDAAWVRSNVATPTSGYSDPLGGTDAWLLSPSGANPKVHQAITTPTSGGNGLMAIWLRSATGSSFSLVIGSDGAGVSPNPTTTTITVTTSWQQFSLPVSWISSSAANFSIGDGSTGWANGNNLYVFAATYSAVTYETVARPIDEVQTTSSIYYGPRFDYNPTTLVSRGILLETDRTNVALWNRDLSNLVWNKIGCVALKNQTGLDGQSSSASSLKATAPNATCLQTYPLASSLRITTAYVKAINVTGSIQMTTDGITWSSVSVSNNWARVKISNQTLANPTFGFRIVNTNDEIAVDYFMNEDGLTATASSESSAILTTNSAVTRSVERLSMGSFGPYWNMLEGTVNIKFDTLNLISDSTVFCIDDASGSSQINQVDTRSAGSTTIRARVRSSANSPPGTSCDLNPVAFSPGADVNLAYCFKVNDFYGAANNSAAPPDFLGEMPATPMTLLRFGERGAVPSPAMYFIGHIKYFAYYNSRLTNSQVLGLTT